MRTAHPHACAGVLALEMSSRKLGQRAMVRFAAGRDVGIALGTVSNLLNGNPPDLDTARKLSKLFERPVIDFLPELADLVPETPAADPVMRRIPLRDLARSNKNERVHFDDAALQDLVDDIASRGLLQPLIVYLDPHPVGASTGLHLVADGGRRWRALKLLEAGGRLPRDLAKHGIPVRLVSAEQALVVTIVANLKREDVHPLDRAAAFARLRDERGLAADQISAMIGIGARSVQQHLQIHDKLSDADKARFLKGEITFRDARDRVQTHKAPEAPPAPEPTPIQHTVDDYIAAVGATRPDAEPVRDRVKRVLAKFNPFAAQVGQLAGICELVPSDQMQELAWEIRQEFDLKALMSTICDDIALIGTVGELTRYVISRMGQPAEEPAMPEAAIAAPPPKAIVPVQPPPSGEAGRYRGAQAMAALGYRVGGSEWRGNELVALTIEAPDGRYIRFVAAQLDIEDAAE